MSLLTNLTTFTSSLTVLLDQLASQQEGRNRPQNGRQRDQIQSGPQVRHIKACERMLLAPAAWGLRPLFF